MLDLLQNVLNKLIKHKDLSRIDSQLIIQCGNEALRLLNKKDLVEYDIACMDLLIQVSQILYNNTDRNLLLLDDGVYDILLEKDKIYNKKYKVGAPPITFAPSGEVMSKPDIITPMEFVDDGPYYALTGLFFDDIARQLPIDMNLIDRNIDRNSGRVMGKRNVNVAHKYPKLVGTLDKCKFTLMSEAKDRGVAEDNGVVIFERDFFGKHLQMGLFDNKEITVIAELKYDGVSVEADVTDHILSARSRGDANADIAADLTPIFGGYKFPYAKEIPEEESFGIKFEAIMTHANVEKLSYLKQRPYANGRNCVIGLMSASDAYDYRDLITLVPISTSLDIDPVTEVEFLNKYYNSGEIMRYSVIKGDYVSVLYQVYKFVKEAEALRPMMPFMYDGVVISYTDPDIIRKLGRENSVNKYSIAIKFNPLVRQAVFTGYTYTIGQNGVVTPMIHYTPVEFYGGIHTKSTGHSYARFKELNLAIGDVLEIEHRNDVMPYVTKCESVEWIKNNNPPEEFPDCCPCCGNPLYFDEKGKSVYCTNDNCPERIMSRVINMMKKLNLKDFGEESLRALNISNLHELLNITEEQVKVLGEVNSHKFMERVLELKSKPIYDYQIIGAVGFSNVASETWKKILNKIPLSCILDTPEDALIDALVKIKGIGKNTAITIAVEREYFFNDLECIVFEMPNVIKSIGLSSGKSVRFTGIRDQDLVEYLNSIGLDANGELGVTKNTDILIVPTIGYTSSKTAKAGDNTIIVDINSFKSNIEKYI